VEEPVAVPPKEVGAADLAGREQEERRAEKNRWRHAGRCGRRGERRGARGQGWAVQREREVHGWGNCDADGVEAGDFAHLDTATRFGGWTRGLGTATRDEGEGIAETEEMRGVTVMDKSLYLVFVGLQHMVLCRTAAGWFAAAHMVLCRTAAGWFFSILTSI
jgi:hypothetical protein